MRANKWRFKAPREATGKGAWPYAGISVAGACSPALEDLRKKEKLKVIGLKPNEAGTGNDLTLVNVDKSKRHLCQSSSSQKEPAEVWPTMGLFTRN